MSPKCFALLFAICISLTAGYMLSFIWLSAATAY
ncbi:hypothetical protein FBZ98_10891 [Rhizobium sp. ERR 922]|nr:hypothetical protein FBZ98_10891 [Rhizobium sp. ERR 922]TWB90194.1 hypothetical protein FBZ97_10991 [Rhizobium sp. ERR 942]